MIPTDIKREFKKIEWKKSWEGHWSILTCSYLEKGYAGAIKKLTGQSLKSSLVIVEKNFSSAYLDKNETDRIAKKVLKNRSVVIKCCGLIKKITDEIESLLSKNNREIVSLRNFKKYIELYPAFAANTYVLKQVPDHLSPNALKFLLPKLTEARLYSEKVYVDTEKFINFQAGLIARKKGYHRNEILSLISGELEKYLREKRLPSKLTLRNRFKATAILYCRNKLYHFFNQDCQFLEATLTGQDHKVIKGTVAYPGKKIIGYARIIADPSKVKHFGKDDILVTGMTRPEFIALFKKAKAVITDSGGILSHAAITARELKRPCIIGTEVATRVLKDGDLIEVDASKGVVRKIN